MIKLFFNTALLDGRWCRNVALDVDDEGLIRQARADARNDGRAAVRGIAVPGLPNVHSHAFQRAMAGLTETAGPGQDSFWTWRELMYRFVDRLDPADLQAVARQAYVEMLRAGFTAVGEFHYVHHQPDGTPYDDPAELSRRTIAAALDTGIAITHLPVLYAAGGFGGVPVAEAQRRFAHDGEAFLRLVAALQRTYGSHAAVRLGIAPHSLRAVPPALLRHVVEAFRRDHPGAPVHIHIAEQRQEVEDCQAWAGARPVQWLMDNAAVDAGWCLVHATHMDDGEVVRLAASGAVAGLCPITEANLGDGLFAAERYLGQDGRIAVGSDSNVRIDAAEELRLLEYGQRLQRQRRAVLARPGGSTGRRLFEACCRGGAAALALPAGGLRAGGRADIVVLDDRHPDMAGAEGDGWLDAWIFAGGRELVRDVYVGGRQVVKDGAHEDQEAIASAYRRTLDRLLQSRS